MTNAPLKGALCGCDRALVECVSYPAHLSQLGEHDHDGGVVLPQHPPEVLGGLGQRALRGKVGLLLPARDTQRHRAVNASRRTPRQNKIPDKLQIVRCCERALIRSDTKCIQTLCSAVTPAVWMWRSDCAPPPPLLPVLAPQWSHNLHGRTVERRSDAHFKGGEKVFMSLCPPTPSLSSSFPCLHTHSIPMLLL